MRLSSISPRSILDTHDGRGLYAGSTMRVQGAKIMGQTTIRSTKSGTRITTRTKLGKTTVTNTSGAGKKAKTTISTKVEENHLYPKLLKGSGDAATIEPQHPFGGFPMSVWTPSHQLVELGKLIAIALLAFGVPAVARAQPDMSQYYSRTLHDCPERDTSGDPDYMVQNRCYAAEIKRWDAELNARYQLLMANLSPDRQLGLRADEREWLRREEFQCAHAADNAMTTDQTVAESNTCKLDNTISRVLYLRSYR